MTLARVFEGLDRALVPLDRLRRALYRVAVPWLGPWIRSREVRAALNACSVVITSFVLALLLPLVLLALGPLLLGVPHLLADVRYLVVRPGLHRRSGALAIAALLVLSSIFVDLRIGLLAAVGMPLLATSSWTRRTLAALPMVGVLALLLADRWTTTVVIAHLHNVVAAVIWLVLAFALHPSTPHGRLARWGPTGLFVLGGGLLLSGTVDASLGWWLGPSLQQHLAELAPGLDPVIGTRWVVCFAYAQAVHYGLWLRVVPEEGRRRPAPRSWRASLEALRRDFGDPALAVVGTLFVALAAWGSLDLVAARAGYLRLALFHGPLELGVLALVLAEGPAVLRP